MSFQVHEKWDEKSMDFCVLGFSCCAISVIVHITGDYYKKLLLSDKKSKSRFWLCNLL